MFPIQGLFSVVVFDHYHRRLLRHLNGFGMIPASALIAVLITRIVVQRRRVLFNVHLNRAAVVSRGTNRITFKRRRPVVQRLHRIKHLWIRKRDVLPAQRGQRRRCRCNALLNRLFSRTCRRAGLIRAIHQMHKTCYTKTKYRTDHHQCNPYARMPTPLMVIISQLIIVLIVPVKYRINHLVLAHVVKVRGMHHEPPAILCVSVVVTPPPTAHAKASRRFSIMCFSRRSPSQNEIIMSSSTIPIGQIMSNVLVLVLGAALVEPNMAEFTSVVSCRYAVWPEASDARIISGKVPR